MNNARYPTTYEVRHFCGHTEAHDLRDLPGPKRQSRANYRAGGPCSDCYHAGLRRPDATAEGAIASETAATTPPGPSKAAESVATPRPGTPAPGANEWFQRRSLPPLNGSPRQVESAIRVRSQLLAGAWAILAATGWEENEFLIGVETYAK